MLNVIFFTFNAFEENTYLISNEHNHCWIVDPGMFDAREADILFSYITTKGLIPQGIINTHTHLDHIFGVNALTGKYSIPFGIHTLDLPLLQRATESAAMFGIDFRNPPAATHYIKDGVPLKLGDDVIEVLLTPGHSPGSISFFYPKGGWVISGDVLFQGSIGRTDLPGGDYDTLINSIRTQLLTLPPDTKVLSGHGPATSIGEEKKHNQFLR